MKETCLFLTSLFALSLPCTADSEILPPEAIHPTSLALIVDQATFEAAEAELAAYRRAVESDGLSTWLVVSEWESPEAVRDAIVGLADRKPTLEGVLLVGMIPVAMIRDGQHLTSAFKMDQERFPIRQSSVPSDRIYDDFDLEFDFLERDEEEEYLFYYSLRADSAQRIEKEIYSARLFPPEQGPAGIERIRAFLERRARQVAAHAPLVNALSFSGHGYRSECLDAWRWEQRALEEQMPWLVEPGARLTSYHHTMTDDLKPLLFHELEQEPLQLVLFHHHGAPDTQYLLGDPEASSMTTQIDEIQRFLRGRLRRAKEREEPVADTQLELMASYGIPLSWFEDVFDEERTKADEAIAAKQNATVAETAELVPRAELVFFDACFNGRFIDRPSIAASYVFGGGDTAAAVGNTVNVLQDVWADEFIGLVGHGARIGQVHRLKNTLESHLIGDPSLRFAPAAEVDAAALLAGGLDDETAKGLLQSPHVALRCLAVAHLGEASDEGSRKDLAAICRFAPASTVRLEALRGLARRRAPELDVLLEETLHDPFELTRRLSTRLMGDIGHDRYAPLLVRTLALDPSRRVSFGAKGALEKLDPAVVKDAFEAFLKGEGAGLARNEALREALERQASPPPFLAERMTTILDEEEELEKRISAARLFRNYRVHHFVPELVARALATDEDPALRTVLLEMLGWFAYSCKRETIVAACSDIIATEDTPERVRQEAKKTMQRLTAGANEPLIP